MKLIEEILSNIKEAPVSLSVDLTEFIDNPIVYNLNIYDFYLQYYNSVKKRNISISNFKNHLAENDNVLIIANKIFPPIEESSSYLFESLSDLELDNFILFLVSSLEKLLNKNSVNSFSTLLESLSEEYPNLEIYLSHPKVRKILEGFLKKTSEFILEEIRLSQEVYKSNSSSIKDKEFISSVISHICSDFSNEASMQQLFTLIVARANAKKFDVNSLIEFLKNENIIEILLNRALFFSNEGYFENGKKVVDNEIQEEINKFLNHFSEKYDPAYPKYTLISTIQKLKNRYLKYDILSFLWKEYPKHVLRCLIKSRIDYVVDNLYIEIAQQRLENRDDDNKTKLEDIISSYFPKIFFYSETPKNQCFVLKLDELNKLFGDTISKIYKNQKNINFAEFRNVLLKMILKVIKNNPEVITLKITNVSGIMPMVIEFVQEDAENVFTELIQQNTKTIQVDNELIDSLSDPTRINASIEELGEKFIIEGEIDNEKYEDYLLRHHNVYRFDIDVEIKAIKEKILKVVEHCDLKDLEEEALSLISKLQNKISLIKENDETNCNLNKVNLIKERLKGLFTDAENLFHYLSNQLNIESITKSERVKNCFDFGELVQIALFGEDEVERFEARRKLAITLRMERITKGPYYVFKERNANSIQKIIDDHCVYNPENPISVHFYDHPEKGLSQIQFVDGIRRIIPITTAEEKSFTSADANTEKTIKLFPCNFNGVECFILPAGEREKGDIIRIKSLNAITIKELRHKKAHDLLAMSLVVNTQAQLEQIVSAIESKFLAYGRVISIKNNLGDVVEIKTKNASYNSSSSSEYRSVKYVVEMSIYDDQIQREVITTLEIRILLLEDLIKEKSDFHHASHKIYESRRLSSVIKSLAPEEIYKDLYEESVPEKWDIHKHSSRNLKKKK